MKGDFTRLSFDPKKHYRGVLMQQGRAQLDSDWNEQVQIAEHRYSTFFGDFVGQSGAPAEGGMELRQDNNFALKLGTHTSIRVEHLPDSQNATIEFWFCMNAFSSQDFQCILAVDGKGLGVDDGYPYVKSMPGEPWRKNDQAEKIDDGSWHYLAWVIKRAEYTGTMQHKAYMHEEAIYVDGEVVGGRSYSVRGQSLPGGGIADVTIPPALQTIEVGAWGGTGQRSNYFGNKVAELRVWNNAIIIGESPTAALSGSESNLIRYYPLTEMDYATTATDHSQSHRDAAIQGEVVSCSGPFQIGTISLSSGRYYVDGLLVERNEEQLLPNLTKGDGLYLAYLDVWTSLITAVDDDALREPALGGPDTTTRIKTESRLYCEHIEEDLAQARIRYWRSWPKPNEAKYDWEYPLSTGELSINTSSVKTADNRLFRLEIHDSGPTGQATFKWSRDNGAIIAGVSQIKGNQIILERPDLAITDAFRGAQYVEVTDEDRRERGEPGIMTSLQHTFVENDSLYAENNLPAFGKGITVRRWDSELIKIKSGNIKLGSDMTISFGRTQAFYRSGDYWLIPVRAGIVLDWVAGSPRPPHGIEHHSAALALIMKQGDQLAIVDNLQTRFQPLTSGNVSKMGDTINGDLSVQGRLSVGSDIFRAPLSITACNGALVSFADESGTESWRIRHQSASSGQPAAFHITDTDGEGLTIQQGNVGIGKMDPANKLAVYDDSDVKISVDCPEEKEAGFVLKSGGNNKWEIYRPRNNNDLRFWESGIGDRVTFQAGGNLGIGTAEPEAKLEINLANTDGWSGNTTGIRLTAPDNQYYLDMKAYVVSSGNVGYQLEPIGPNSTNTGLVIDTWGNVGVGKTEPGDKLAVYDNDYDDTGVKISVDCPDAREAGFILKSGGTNKWEIYRPRNSGDLRFWESGIGDRVTFQVGGKVGIGTSEPKGALHVNPADDVDFPLIIESNQTFNDPTSLRDRRNAAFQLLNSNHIARGTICIGGVSNQYILFYFKAHDGKIFECHLDSQGQILASN